MTLMTRLKKGVVSFRNMLQSHLSGISWVEHSFFFNKEILEFLIGEILFENFGEEDHDYDKEFI